MTSMGPLQSKVVELISKAGNNQSQGENAPKKVQFSEPLVSPNTGENFTPATPKTTKVEQEIRGILKNSKEQKTNEREKENRPNFTDEDRVAMREAVNALNKEMKASRTLDQDVKTNPDLQTVEIVEDEGKHRSYQAEVVELEPTEPEFNNKRAGMYAKPAFDSGEAKLKAEHAKLDLSHFENLEHQNKETGKIEIRPNPNYVLKPPPLPPRRTPRETPEAKLERLQSELRVEQDARDNMGSSFSANEYVRSESAIKSLIKDIEEVKKEQFEKGRPSSGGREFKNFDLQRKGLKGFDAIFYSMKFGKNEETIRPDKRYADAIQEAGRQFDKQFNRFKEGSSQRLERAGLAIQNLREKINLPSRLKKAEEENVRLRWEIEKMKAGISQPEQSASGSLFDVEKEMQNRLAVDSLNINKPLPDLPEEVQEISAAVKQAMEPDELRDSIDLETTKFAINAAKVLGELEKKGE